ncbi:hypothetical protein AAFF_G00287460 [Aldrovandia affinis]|uniref:Leukocyte cell-derived chemotaxin 1 n=1 Tax=Aldrovandia affinis TaxID=143900 RepID=A0AAD7WS66_9TELE|nr:hypothetical protein AAFF_G00287460 [Aldrovandia affinis]
MAETSEKTPIAMAGPEDMEQHMPPAYTAVTMKPTSSGRLLKIGAAVLIAGAALLLFGAIGALYFWKVNDKHQVYNVHYSMSINGKVEEGSMEIDARNNLERFRTGSGDDEAVEVHDFHIGITGIRFSGGEKCYIKTQAKAHLPEVETLNKESVVFDLEDEIMPVKFDEESLIWVAGDQPVKDCSFLSSKILDLCGDQPIFWLHPTYPKDGQRKRRDAFEEAAEQRNTATTKRDTEDEDDDDDDDEEDQTYNPENPYHRNAEGEEGTMIFDPMLDHQGICCTECRRSHTQCQRICEPLGGYWPWPYNYRGCRVACRPKVPREPSGPANTQSFVRTDPRLLAAGPRARTPVLMGKPPTWIPPWLCSLAAPRFPPSAVKTGREQRNFTGSLRKDITRKDSYPLPRIDDALKSVVGSTWFSALDLRSDYWQVPLSPSARPKTAFNIGRGLWEFNVMPFVLCNNPAMFKQLMEKVLQPVPVSACMVYLDDILVHVSTYTAVLANLSTVFDLIAKGDSVMVGS